MSQGTFSAMPNQTQTQDSMAQDSTAHSPTAQRSKPRHNLPKSYVAVWGVLATVAGSYLGVALFAPNLFGLPAMGAGQERVATAGGAGKSSRQLQERLSRAQLEIAKLRTELSQQTEAAAVQVATADSQDTQAVDAARSPLRRAESIVTTSIMDDDIDTSAVAASSGAPDTKVVRVPQAVSEVAVAQAQIVNAQVTSNIPPAGSTIETGSISVPPMPTRAPAPPLNPVRVAAAPASIPEAFNAIKPSVVVSGAPAVLPTPTPPAQVAARPADSSVGVRLATGPSIDVLRLRWRTMMDRAGSAMGGLEPYFVPSTRPGALGPTYDLIAGPLKTLSDAQRICNAAAVGSSVCEIRRLEGSRAL